MDRETADYFEEFAGVSFVGGEGILFRVDLTEFAEKIP